jgi:uncharacterized spore protein YtfJ
MTNIAVTLAEAVRSFGVGASYGAPIELNGAKIVPVALVSYGFGGGSEEGTLGDGPAAGGGGGGGSTIPIGAYITNAEGKATFQPNIVSLLAVSIPLIFVTGRALSRVIRALKK